MNTMPLSSDQQKAYLEIHLAVLLFSFTAILGGLIQMPALLLVWWRLLMTLISLVFLVRAGRLFRDLPLSTILQFMGIGLLVAAQWLTFYGAIKLANASVTLIAMATTSFFTALLEPVIMRSKIQWLEVALGLLIVPGMMLIVNYVETDMLLGLGIALLSAVFAAAYTTFNKKLIGRSDPLRITFLEMGSAWLVLSLALPLYFGSGLASWSAFWPVGIDWFYLIALSIVCTVFAYVLALRSLRYLSAFASNLIINLEPVYGMMLAWLILQEHKDFTPEFYLGVGVLLLAVFGYPVIKKRLRR
jgi:drug/metabolite transporter (DMT)-like permease